MLCFAGVLVLFSATYYEVDHSILFADLYLRAASNGDIMYYDDNNNTEYLYIPASPALNQTWIVRNGAYYKIVAVNATVTTSSCSYTGCVQIEFFSSSGSSYGTKYYKKGIGFIKDTGSFLTATLSEIHLY